jgi:hypothetical protein
MVGMQGVVPDALPDVAAPKIQMILPVGPPEQIPAPQADSPAEDRFTRAPQRLTLVPGRSWIFTPPLSNDNATVRR